MPESIAWKWNEVQSPVAAVLIKMDWIGLNECMGALLAASIECRVTTIRHPRCTGLYSHDHRREALLQGTSLTYMYVR